MTDPQLPPPSGDVPPVPPPAGQPPAGPSSPAYPPVPPAPAPPTPAPSYPGPQAAPGHPAAPGYPAAPVPQPAPPGAYQVPVGGYAAPAGPYAVPAVTAKNSGLLGILALVLALVAAVVTPIIAGVAGFEIGRRLPGGIDTNDPDLLTLLSPARDQVLWAELSFWAGTILGIAAIVVGILAIRKRQRRGLGITALIVAVLGPVIFWVVLLFAVSAGTATGMIGYTG